MARFSAGDRVHLEGRPGVYIVKDGRQDSDDDIKVYDAPDRDHGSWSFRYIGKVTPATTPVEAVASQLNSTPNQEGNTTMANTARSIVKVVLIDQDAGLDPSKALVKDFGEHVLEGPQEDLKMEIVMGANMESILRAHNEMRAKEVDLDIRQRTGNEVKLTPRKLGELTWKIGTVA